MEQALKKFYGRKREQRQADMKEFSAKWIVPSLSLGSLPSQETSNLSLDDARGSKTQRLPKIWGAHPMPGRAMTERNSVGRGPRHQFRRNDGTKGGSMSDAGGGVHPENSQLTFNSSIHHASMTSTNATSRPQADSRYYTAKVAPMHVDFVRMEDEADVVTAVAFSLDGITQQSKFHRQSDAEHATSAEAFTFQPSGSPVGTLLIVKLLGSRRTAAGVITEIGTGLVDLTTVPVGGAPVTFTCPLETEFPRTGPPPSITLELRLYARRKSFTFSYLRSDPVFRRAGYEISLEGIRAFPTPYKKDGLPPGVTYASLSLEMSDTQMRSGKASEAQGYEVWRATDQKGRRYTVKKFLVTDAGCRELLTAELDGLLDCAPDQAVPLCDAFLDGVTVSMVFADKGGVYLRDSIQERGAVPEMVIAIVVRQLAQILQHLHEQKSRLHNDLDARNVQVGLGGEVRLGGFCYSLKHVGKASKFSGPYSHMAPERLLGLGCSFPSDVWSLGILAYEMATAKGPYDLSSLAPPPEIKGPGTISTSTVSSVGGFTKPPPQHPPGAALFKFRQLVAAEQPPSLIMVPGISAELKSLVKECLQKNVRARASITDILAHPFITRVEGFTLPAGSWVTKKAVLPTVAALNFK